MMPFKIPNVGVLNVNTYGIAHVSFFILSLVVSEIIVHPESWNPMWYVSRELVISVCFDEVGCEWSGELEGRDRIFVGGLPYYFIEAHIRELLESFGPLRGFDLVKDRETGKSEGYAFCVYQDFSVKNIYCEALNGGKMGDKTLTVRRAN